MKISKAKELFGDDILDKFVLFCNEYLEIKTPCRIILTDKRDDIKTTALYHPGSELTKPYIKIYKKDRAMVDLLRSIAHELTHHMQNEQGKLQGIIPDIGGEIEDEANAKAGQIIKLFCYEHIDIYQ